MGFYLHLSSLVLFAAFTTSGAATDFQVKPFKVDLTAQIPRLTSRLPAKTLYSDRDGGSGEWGIELDVLQELRTDWLMNFDWEAQWAELNTSLQWSLTFLLHSCDLERLVHIFEQFTAVIEGLTVHFTHEKSADPEAIPVILCHGWPLTPVILSKYTQALSKNSYRSSNH
ncbi:epoxide hydrolase N terminus-domain-containing protein [Mycena alexandri]|uniref:Epoxide hydrolase N terminus-domain-containing protein n=1 Tax=Mycena alexandri TaxID=1745969 RepID=A0AAD6TF02_9AGAR|nr:epoxide hydrolase N terminus-domain-containing protein [Mycena alexandri]